MMEVNMSMIGGLMFNLTLQLLETIDGFYQRMKRHFRMTDKGGEESLRGMKMFVEEIDN